MTSIHYLASKFRLHNSFFYFLIFTVYVNDLSAQLSNVPVTGFTNDIVANGVGISNTSTTGTLPGVTYPSMGIDANIPAAYSFIDATYQWYSGSALPTCYLPTNGAIPSALTPGLTYQLQSYSANNAMTVASNTFTGSVHPTTGTLTLATPASYGKLYVLYETVLNTAGPTITATVTFTDLSTQVFSGNTVVNWFTATGVAYTPSISRAPHTAPGAPGACGTGPYLFELPLTILPANYGKLVQSITINWSAATGTTQQTVDYFHALAVGGLVPCGGTPTPGNTISSSNPACSGVNFTLSTQFTTGAGATYQWQSSPDGVTWTNISGATSATASVTQTATTYYRCNVTCGANTGASTPVIVNMAVPLNGTYTINSGVASGGTNFQSFSAFKDILNCTGVSGPVIVNVVAGTGPYTEQVQFNVVPGMSATNTVTINGNGNTLTYAATLSTAPGTLVLNGTDYMTVNNLIVAGTGGTYALVCHLYNQADNNTFSGCTFNAPANGTSTTQVPFSISGSATSATTSGVSGNNNLVTNCTMFSGYYNTCFVGNSAAINTGNQLINCNIRDQYFYATYILYQNGMIVRGNTLERPTRTTLSTYYGLYISTACINVLVENNKVRNTWAAVPTSTGTQYSIYNTAAGAAGSENRFYNNLVSDINFNGTIYGMYFSGSNYCKAYHNTISLDQTGATGTTTTYGIYSTGTLTRDFRNNIVSISRGGTGTKYCVYYTTPATVTSNNNVLYLNSTAGTNYFGYNGTTNYSTFATWQSGSGKDAASVGLSPLFNNPGLGDYTPTSSSVNNIGASVGVTTDITGATRSVLTPDPGCIEFNLTSIDMSIQSMTAPNLSGCYGTNEGVTVLIKNSGNDPIDFSLNPATITVVVNGPTSSVVTESLTSGTLGIAQTQTVILNPPIDLTVDGVYNFTGTISTVGDGNSANDNLTPAVNITVGVVPGTITSNLSNPICVSYQPTFTLTGQYGGSKQWQMSTVGSSGPWTNVGSGGNTYTPTGINQNYWVRVESNCNTNYAYSNILAVNVVNPTLASTINGQRCGTGTVNLSAIPNGSATVNWYANPTGGVALASSTSTFTTPVISSTTTYYAVATDGGTSGTLGLPNRVGATTNSGYSDIGLMFTATQPFTLNSVAVYPVATTPSGNVTVTIALKNSAGTILQSTTASLATSVSPGIKTVVPLNFSVPVGTNHRLVFTSATGGGITGFIREVTTGYTYPYTYPGVASITSAYTSGASSSYYYYFYDWSISTGCEGIRLPVVATVNTAPAINPTAPSQICQGQTASLNVTSSDPDYVYTWQPGNLSGASQTVSPTANTTYSLTAYNPLTQCQLLASLPVVVNTNPTLSSITASPTSVNPGCNTAVTLTATTSAPTTVLVGNASSTTTTSSTGVTPYSSFYESGRIQYLITAAELTSLGFSAGTFSSIGFDVTATSAYNQTGYTIKMGHTAATALSGYATIIGSLQTVYGPVLMTPPPLGVNTYNFGTSFNWDGINNVIIEICHDNDNSSNTCGICYGTAGTVRYTATTPNTVYGTYNDNSTLCGTGVGTLTVTTNTRPNIYLNGIAGQITTKVWNPGSMTGNSVSVTPTVTSTYSVTCTNATTGCTTAGNVTVTMNPNATISGLNPSYSSAASAVTMTGTPSGGVFSGPGVTGNSFDPAVAGVGTHTISYLPTGYCIPATTTVIVLPNNAILNLKCYVQGFYMGSGMMQPVLNNQGQSNPTTDCDTVIVELHDASTPYATAYTFTGILQTNGTITCTFPAAAQGNNYYIVVNHRNAMQTWSANPVAIGAVTNYDFSTAITKAYGDNQIQVETGVFAFYSGDINQDFSIDAFDYLMMDPDIYNGAGGWLATDLNGDGSVDAFDYLIYDPNGYNGITIQSP